MDENKEQEGGVGKGGGVIEKAKKTETQGKIYSQPF